MKVIKLNESDIKRIVKKVLNETHGVTDMKNKEMKEKLSGDTVDKCNTSKDYFNYVNNIGHNDGRTQSWDQFWGNIIRKLKDDNGIDTTKEKVCACLKQNVVYKSQTGEYRIDKMCSGKR